MVEAVDSADPSSSALNRSDTGVTLRVTAKAALWAVKSANSKVQSEIFMVQWSLTKTSGKWKQSRISGFYQTEL